MRASEPKTNREPAHRPAVAPPQRSLPALTPTVEGLAFQLSTRTNDSTGAEREADAAASAVVGGETDAGESSDAPSETTLTTPFGVIVDDDVTPSPDQIKRTEFLDAIGAEIESVANEELDPAGRTARDCPYLVYWLAFYRERPAVQVECAIQRYARPERPDLDGLREAILARVRSAVQAWVRSDGRDVQVPEGIDVTAPSDVDGSDAPEPSEGESDEETASIQRKEIAGTSSVTPPASDPAAVRAQLGDGHPLEGGVRSRMERGFGLSFDGVRLHTDGHAARMAQGFSARAFTVGRDIAFGAGEYRPGSLAGDALLAHELAHVVQQRSATVAAPAQTKGGEQGSHGLEEDADRSAFGALFSLWGSRRFSLVDVNPSTTPQLRSGLQLQRCSKEPRLKPAAEVGYWQGQIVALREVVAGSSTIDTEIRAERTVGVFGGEAAALAAVKANGKAGAVTLEMGRYGGYETDQQFSYKERDFNSGEGSTTFEVPRALPGVVALVSSEGVTLRPGEFNPDASRLQPLSSEQALTGTDDPFQGYKDAFGGGKGLDDADDQTLLLAFTAAMKDTALAVLNNSEQVVREKQKTFGGKGEGVAAVELAAIKTTARELADLDRQISEQEALRTAYQPEPPRAFTGLSSDPPTTALFTIVNSDKYMEACKNLDALNQQRAVVLTQYPMLARIKPEEFIQLKDDEMLSTLGSELPGILKDIAETRENVADGEINLWGLKQIVETTLAGLGIRSEAKRKVIQDKAKSEATANTIKEIVKTVFMIGLGLAAAFVGGPLGLAFAAGALGLSLYDAIAQTRQYGIQKPASNTDIDPSSSLVPPDQVAGWGWLIVAWVGVGIDAAVVVKTVGALAKAEKSLALAIEDLAEQNAKRLGVPKEELLSRLKLAAGEIDPAIQITEGARTVLARRLGLSIEIDSRLGADVRIYYALDEATGKLRVVGMRCGSAASVADILAHQEVLGLMRRYEGATGKIRGLWERLVSVGGKSPPSKNPFPPGSAAYESWFEVKKLPQMIKLRTDRLSGATKGAMNAGQEAQLRADVEFIENELANHQKVVDQLVLEAGSGYIAKTGESTAEAAKRGFRLPDIEKPAAEMAAEDISKSEYYYRVNERGDGFDLVRKARSNKPPLRAETNPDGSFKGFAEGELTRTEMAEKIVQGYSKQNQDAFNALKLAEGAKGNRVVPIQGMAATDKTIGDLIKGNPGVRQQIFEIIFEALTRKNEKEAAKIATEAVESLMSRPITVVQGTDQLRAFGYRRYFTTATGQVIAEGDDLHHLIPLYLGGEHRITNLIDISEDLHRRLHKLIEEIPYKDVTLAPGAIQRAKDLNFRQGAGILKPDGSVELRPFE